MIYKLLHYLFGWDYVAWSNSASQGIARIYISPDERVYYWRYKNIQLADVIYERDQVLWLTCKPEKYGFK